VEVDGYDEEAELEKREVQVAEHYIDGEVAGHDVVHGVDKELGVEGEVDAGEVVDEIHVVDVEGAAVIEVEGVLVVVADVDLEEVESDDEIVDAGHIEGHGNQDDHNTTEEVQGLARYSLVQMRAQESDQALEEEQSDPQDSDRRPSAKLGEPMCL
jgi:isopentenyldiphosphate isomerase